MIEEWRDIKDFNYQVSNLGRVRNSKGLNLISTNVVITSWKGG